MKSPRQPGFDRHSETFKDASAIIGSGKDSAKTPAPPGMPSTAPNTPSHGPSLAGIERIHVEPTENGGAIVRHTLKAPPGEKGNDAPYGSREKTHAFGSAAEAHAHLATLMDCPNCSQSE